MLKTFFTYEQQLNKLQHEKGLIIPNAALNKRNYSNINRLVNSMKKAIALPSRYTYISHHATTYGNVPIHYSRTTTYTIWDFLLTGIRLADTGKYNVARTSFK